jgi:hypothetical protein
MAMKFMMLMIPAVYRAGTKVDPGFVPDPEKVAEMGRFNDEMAKSVKILSLNGLHPVAIGARVSFAQADRDRRPLHRDKGSAGRLLAGRGEVEGRGHEVGAAVPGE